ncbi:MAG: hypothetical protein QXU98_08795 [Candidatus Parvarchaeota archaeon]
MISTEKREEIKEMKHQGMTITFISKKIHVSRPTITKYLKETGNPLVEKNIVNNASESY